MQTTTPRGIVVYRQILLVLGGLVLLGAGLQFGRGVLRGMSSVDNLVFANVQRLPHEQTMLQHAGSYGVDILILTPWLLLLLMTAYVVALLLNALYRSAPAAVLTAGAFLGGALISGVLVATSLLRVVEFVVQAETAAPAEVAWLTGGINYLTQIHLFYVSAWILATGLGWLFLGAAARSAGGAWRPGGLLLLSAGGLFVLGTINRMLLPLAGTTVPGLMLGLVETILSAGFGLGLLGYAALLQPLRHSAPAAGSPPTPAQPVRTPSRDH